MFQRWKNELYSIVSKTRNFTLSEYDCIILSYSIFIEQLLLKKKVSVSLKIILSVEKVVDYSSWILIWNRDNNSEANKQACNYLVPPLPLPFAILQVV